MLAFTGMRRGELIHLRLSNIDMKSDIIEIRGEHIKEGREKDIPISPVLKKYLEKDLGRRKKSEVWFLDNERGDHYFMFADSLTAGFKKHLNKLGVIGIKPLHGFRATVASRLLNEENYDISHVRDLLGHSDIKTTLGYKKKDLPKLREAVSSLSNGKKKKRKKTS
jgi:integrase/recombinase XerC